MTAREREIFRARMRTLDQVRAEVWSPDGVTLKLRAPLYCDPKLKGHRWVPRTETSL